MKKIFRPVAAIIGLTTLLAVTALSDTAVALHYKVTDLGTLPGESVSEASALNDQGQVIGVCSTGGEGKAFLWEKGVMRPLPVLPGFRPLSLWPRAINNQGQIVGTDFGPNMDTRRAFLIDKGIIRDLGTPPGEYSEAFGINDRGQVIGKSYTLVIKNKGEHHVDISYTFVWSKEMGFRKLNAQTNNFGDGLSAINNSGQIVGASMTLGIEEEKTKRASLPLDKQPIHGNILPSAAFLWENGQVRSISPPPSWSSGGIALNEQGEVLGRMSLYPEADEILTSSTEELTKIQNAMRHSHHTFLWRNGKTQDLGEMGTEPQVATTAFNNADDIVGYVRLADNTGFRAFLWRNGIRHMLTDLISPADGWILSEAQGINNHGQIIGVGLHHGQRHAYLLTPH
jgi:probable HAF family extracellular repeat protein